MAAVVLPWLRISSRARSVLFQLEVVAGQCTTCVRCGRCLSEMVRPAAGRMGEWTGLGPSPSCFGVSLFRHEIVGYKGHGLVREGVLHLR